MKKVYKLENLDCANCASKMENAIIKIEGVKNAAVNFMMQRMTIEADDSASFDEIMKKTVSICKKIEPDCVIKL